MADPRQPWLLLSGASGVAAGLLGAAVVLALGGPLAMGLAIWSGRSTEPAMPEVDYPWPLVALGLGVAALGARRVWVGARGGGLLLHLGAALLAALPFVWLGVLTRRAAP